VAGQSGDRSKLHGIILRLEKLLDAGHTALATDATLLDPAKGSGWIRHKAAVYAEHAGIDLPADAHRPLEVLAIDIGSQPVLRIIGESNGILLGFEAVDSRHRAEDFLTGNGCLDRHVF